MAFYPRQSGTTETSFKIGVGHGKHSQTIDATGLTTDLVWRVPTDGGGFGYTLQTDGSGNLSWALPGASTDKTTPYNILSTETYTVAINKQALYAEDIEVDGNLVVDGDLIDTRSAGGGSATITLTGNVTGTGSGTIDTTIPVLASNNSSSLSSAVASGIDSMSLGFGSVANGERSYVIGPSSGAYGYGAGAIGRSATANGGYAVAIGYNSGATGDSTTAIGQSAQVYAARGTAIGSLATTSSDSSTAIGYQANASGDTSMAIGFGAHSAGAGSSSAIGSFAHTYGSGSTALAGSTSTYGPSSVAIGQGCVTQTSAERGTSMGWESVATCPGALTFAAHENANAKSMIGNLAQKTVDATPKGMYICQGYNFIYGTPMLLEDNFTYIITSQFVGTNNTDYYAAKYDLVVSILSGVVTIQGTPVKTVITQTSGATAWDIGYVTTSGVGVRFNFTVTGDASSTCYWTGSFTAAGIQTV
jgi:hypothetical protein